MVLCNRVVVVVVLVVLVLVVVAVVLVVVKNTYIQQRVSTGCVARTDACMI